MPNSWIVNRIELLGMLQRNLCASTMPTLGFERAQQFGESVRAHIDVRVHHEHVIGVRVPQVE